MAYRSWLRDVRSIHDLGEHCHAPFDPYKEDSVRREDAYEDKWLARLRRGTPVAPEYKEFFGSYMHDSWVRSVQRKGGDLTVRLISINADIFALAVCELLDLEPRVCAWHVDLVLRDACYVNAVRQNATGRLRWSDWTHWVANDQFLYDWFFEQDGRLQWIAVFWAHRRPSRGLDHNLHLLVDCKEAVAVDHRRSDLERAFSPEIAELWDDVAAGVEFNGSAPWGSSLMQDYLLRRIEARGTSSAALHGSL